MRQDATVKGFAPVKGTQKCHRSDFKPCGFWEPTLDSRRNLSKMAQDRAKGKKGHEH